MRALLDMGFRPFFLLASLYAAFSVGLWLLTLSGGWLPPAGWPATWWHGHEMVFGFTACAIAGFLLTAVPNWTQTAHVRDGRLAFLVATWFLGRLALHGAGLLPAALVALLDLAFLPVLTVFVGVPILRSGGRHNYPVVGVLVLLFAANCLVHLERTGLARATAWQGLMLGVFAVTILLTLISGRLTPLFTRNRLRQRGEQVEVTSQPGVEKATVAAMLLAVALEMLLPRSLPAGLACLATSALLFLRARHWQWRRTLGEPLLWVLHLGNLWLVVGFACLGVADLWGGFPGATALHVLSTGAIGTTILGVMPRVTLGHTGREMRAGFAITAAFVAVSFGAILRSLLPLLLPGSYDTLLRWGGMLWAAGYLVFPVVYWRALTERRPDGSSA